MMSDLALSGNVRRGVSPAAASQTLNRHALTADVLFGAEAYLTLRDDWQRLTERQNGTSVFQAPAMLAAWAHYFAPESSQALATIVVRHEDRAVLIWPLVVERRGPFRIACGAGSPIAQYDEVLLDPDHDGGAAVEAALAALTKAIRPDVVSLERVRADSALRAALPTADPLCSEGAPYTDLSNGMEGVRATRKPRVLRQQKKRMRTFSQEGKVAFDVAGNPEEAEAWLEEALSLKRDWLRQTGRVSRAFMKPETTSCLVDLAQTLSGEGTSPRMVVSRLSLDGRTAAVEVGFCHRGAYHLYLGAFQPEFAKLGPGNVLTENVLEWCIAHGVTRYDMLAPRSRNKREWQSDEVAIVDFALPLTLPGRLYAALVVKRLTPALRDLFYALPPRIRTFIAGRALRL